MDIGKLVNNGKIVIEKNDKRVYITKEHSANDLEGCEINISGERIKVFMQDKLSSSSNVRQPNYTHGPVSFSWRLDDGRSARQIRAKEFLASVYESLETYFFANGNKYLVEDY